MRTPVWLSGIIAGIILLFLGYTIDNPTLERATDTFLIFGYVVIVVSITVGVVSLVKGR